MADHAVVVVAGGPTGLMVAGELALAGVDVELSDGESLRADYLVGCDGGRSPVRKTAGIAFPGWDPTTSSLTAEVEMAEEPEWGIRRDALGIHSLSRMGDGGPVRQCDILERTHKGGSGWTATCWVSRRSTRRRSRSLAARARTWGSFADRRPPCAGWLCVTTAAFQRIMAEAPSIDDRLDRLSRLKPNDQEAIRALSAEIRRTIEGIAIPDDLAAAITRPFARLGEHAAYAVRSSATAEDLPTASFAGQQDTYLNVVGPAAILNVSRCWASLFTERAVTYRLRNGFDHRKVHMAVVVQQMVFPQAAGILFTADPVTGNRRSHPWRPASASARPWSPVW